MTGRFPTTANSSNATGSNTSTDANCPDDTRSVRFWDLAATEPSSRQPRPRLHRRPAPRPRRPQRASSIVTDLVRVRKAPGAVEQLVDATAQLDGNAVKIIIEQEPGAAGRAVTDRYKRHVLRGYNVRGDRATGAKDVRASVAAAAAENGLIKIVRGRNTNEFLDELSSFPHGPHDDCVDALSGAHQALSHGRGQRMRSYVPRGNIYEIKRAPRNRTRPPRSRFQIAQRQHLEDERAAQLAAAIGTTLYDPRRCDSEPKRAQRFPCEQNKPAGI